MREDLPSGNWKDCASLQPEAAYRCSLQKWLSWHLVLPLLNHYAKDAVTSPHLFQISSHHFHQQLGVKQLTLLWSGCCSAMWGYVLTSLQPFPSVSISLGPQTALIYCALISTSCLLQQREAFIKEAFWLLQLLASIFLPWLFWIFWETSIPLKTPSFIYYSRNNGTGLFGLSRSYPVYMLKW